MLLVLLFPLIGLVAFIVLFSTGKSPFFVQLRPGKNEKVFTLIKLKTMNNNSDENGDLLSDEQRLTSIGRIIRKLSIDEIPQLYNVLVGDMSIVGPRPLLVRYLDRYNSMQKQRHNVRPGITGLAQVNGRNSISWDQKFDFDIYYVNNISFRLDVKILFLTVLKIVKQDGISSDTSATMEEFFGTE